MALKIETGTTRLAPGPHWATVDEIRTNFVDAFPRSRTRVPIFESWLQLRELISRLVAVEYTIVDGSFVTSKKHPRDIDFVTVVSGQAYDQLNEVPRRTLSAVAGGDLAFRDKSHCHSFLVAAYPAGHIAHPVAAKRLDYWTTLFSSDKQDKPKGYIKVGP